MFGAFIAQLLTTLGGNNAAGAAGGRYWPAEDEYGHQLVPVRGEGVNFCPWLSSRPGWGTVA